MCDRMKTVQSTAFGTLKCGPSFIQLIRQQEHIYSFNDLKFTLKHLKSSYMFRSYDHPQGACIVSC